MRLWTMHQRPDSWVFNTRVDTSSHVSSQLGSDKFRRAVHEPFSIALVVGAHESGKVETCSSVFCLDETGRLFVVCL